MAFIDDNAMKLSAALSYYTIFSLPPLLIIIISISGFLYGEEAVRGELFGQINGLIGNEAAMQIQETIKNVRLSGYNSFVTGLGILVLIIGASGVFVEIQDSLNFIWRIKAKPKHGLIKFITNRLVSFSMIGSVGFLLLVSLFVSSVMDLLNRRLEALFPLDLVYIFYALNVVVVFIIITILFVVIFITLPDGKLHLRSCIIGASFTSVLFMLGKFLISLYLSSSAIASVYGAAGSVILILMWVYYSAMILYFGAEFTKIYSRSLGKKIIPNEYAEQVNIS